MNTSQGLSVHEAKKTKDTRQGAQPFLMWLRGRRRGYPLLTEDPRGPQEACLGLRPLGANLRHMAPPYLLQSEV